MGVSEERMADIIGGLNQSCSVQVNSGRHKLKQRYVVLRKLGQGTYGKVQLAINKETNQEVAIKTVKKKRIETEQDLQRIRREIQILSSVTHPHIVHIYEVFENREKMVLVMEYAAGGELFDYLSERQCLSDDEARRIFRQIASACFYCHQNNICHRDLKLENILLDEYGNAKIADFGLSTVFCSDTALTTYCGSPLYASPEIVCGTPYCGPEVDCWSLGVLLYTLVYGAMPFDGSNFKRLVKQITTGHYYEPDPAAPASELIGRLLTVSRHRRIAIGDVCRHWWVNQDSQRCCLSESEQLYLQTPVRLDLLLCLTESSSSPPLPFKESPGLSLAPGDDVSSGDVSRQMNTGMASVGVPVHCDGDPEAVYSVQPSETESDVELAQSLPQDPSQTGCASSGSLLRFLSGRSRRVRSALSSRSLDSTRLFKRRKMSDCSDVSASQLEPLNQHSQVFPVVTSSSISLQSLPRFSNEIDMTPLRVCYSSPSRLFNLSKHYEKFSQKNQLNEERINPSCCDVPGELSDKAAPSDMVRPSDTSNSIAGAHGNVRSDSKLFSIISQIGCSLPQKDVSLGCLRKKCSSAAVAGVKRNLSLVVSRVQHRPVSYRLQKVSSMRGGKQALPLQHQVLSPKAATITDLSKNPTDSFESRKAPVCSAANQLPSVSQASSVNSTLASEKDVKGHSAGEVGDDELVDVSPQPKSEHGVAEPSFRSELSIQLCPKPRTTGVQKTVPTYVPQMTSFNNAASSHSTSSVESSSTELSSATTEHRSDSEGTITPSCAAPKPLRKSHREVIIPIMLEDGESIMPSSEQTSRSSSTHWVSPGSQRLSFSAAGTPSPLLSQTFHRTPSRGENINIRLSKMNLNKERHSSLSSSSSASRAGPGPSAGPSAGPSRVPSSAVCYGSQSDSSDGETDNERFSVYTADCLYSGMMARVRNLSRQMRLSTPSSSVGPAAHRIGSGLSPRAHGTTLKQASLNFTSQRAPFSVMGSSQDSPSILRYQDNAFRRLQEKRTLMPGSALRGNHFL